MVFSKGFDRPLRSPRRSGYPHYLGGDRRNHPEPRALGIIRRFSRWRQTTATHHWGVRGPCVLRVSFHRRFTNHSRQRIRSHDTRNRKTNRAIGAVSALEGFDRTRDGLSDLWPRGRNGCSVSRIRGCVRPNSGPTRRSPGMAQRFCSSRPDRTWSVHRALRIPCVDIQIPAPGNFCNGHNARRLFLRVRRSISISESLWVVRGRSSVMGFGRDACRTFGKLRKISKL